MGLRFALALVATTSTAGALLFVACSVQQGGIIEPVVPMDTSMLPDTTPLPDVTPLPSCWDASTCLKVGVPEGWAITALQTDTEAGCPANFTNFDQLKYFQYTPNSCSCTCTVSGTAACGDSIVTTGDSGSSCAMADAGLVKADGTCSIKDGGGGQGIYVAVSQPALTGVSCVANEVGMAAAGSVPVRLCAPKCEADFCGQINGQRTACIYTTGAVSCPPNYTQKTLIADGTNPSCAACSCGQPTGSCRGFVHFDNADNTCGATTYIVVADGTCNGGLGGNSSYSSASMTTGFTQLPACAAAPVDPGGDAGAMGVKTVCCP